MIAHNALLDSIESTPSCSPRLEPGFDNEHLLELGKQVGYRDWRSLYDGIISVLVWNELLHSAGIPKLDDEGHFARWVEPYYPSLHLRLLALN